MGEPKNSKSISRRTVTRSVEPPGLLEPAVRADTPLAMLMQHGTTRRPRAAHTLALAIPLALTLVAAACSGNGESTPAPTAPTPTPSPSPTPAPPPSSGCNPAISGLPGVLPALGGRFPMTVSAAAGCAWTVRSDSSWADPAPSSGSGTANLTLNVVENTRPDSRTLTLTVGTQNLRVTQTGTTCVVTFSAPVVEVSDQGGRLQIPVTTSASCPWTATSTQSWIRVVTPEGTGSGTLLLDVEANRGDLRQGVVMVGSQALTITQRRG